MAYNVAVCIPTRGHCLSNFAYDLTALTMKTMEVLTPAGSPNQFGILMNGGTYIHKNRQELAQTALESGATHLLWLDDDMRFPPDTLLQLLSHKVDIVGANYTTRGIEAAPVALKRLGLGEQPPERLFTGPNDTGLVPVEGLGFGCVLVAAPVFDRIPSPWFENYWNREKKYWVGEDIDFCMKARAAGIDVLVDHDLSKEVAHTGSFEYRTDHANAVREMMEASGGDQ